MTKCPGTGRRQQRDLQTKERDRGHRLDRILLSVAEEMDVNVYGTAKAYWGTMGGQSHLQEPRDPGEDTGTEGNQENPGSPRPKEMGCQAGKRNRVHGSQKKKNSNTGEGTVNIRERSAQGQRAQEARYRR